MDIGIDFNSLTGGDLKTILNAVSELSEAMKSTVDLLFKIDKGLTGFTTVLEDLIEGHEAGSVDKIREMTMVPSPDQKKWQRIQSRYERFGKATNISSLRGILWRLKSVERDGLFRGDSRPVEEAIFEGKLAVIQGSVKLIQMYATYLIRNLYKKRRDYKDAQFVQPAGGDYFPPFFVVTDESHTFAPKGIPARRRACFVKSPRKGGSTACF